jgi:hypothetical protein
MRLPLPLAPMLLVAAVLYPGRGPEPTPPIVTLVSLPDGGIQPQALVDPAGVLHVLYFTGTPAAGDLYYVRRESQKGAFSKPVRVNSLPGSALATGSVRGGQFALGRNGRIHVAWHGAKDIGSGAAAQTPVWYARLADGGGAFGPQVNVAVSSEGIDGSTIAADGAGNVYVAWHARGAKDGEANRTVYVARSTDDGAHFAREAAVAQASTGACACCGLRALADRSGTPQILYRAATDGVHRAATWLTLSKTFPKPVALQNWDLNVCPMSTFAMAQDGSTLIAAWETAQQIYYSRLDPARQTFSPPAAVDGRASRKHPSIAANVDGVGVVAWAEGTAWARGGTLAWQSFDRSGQRLGGASKAAVVPAWGLVAVVANRDGSFAILH